MGQNADANLAAATWTRLTNATVTAIRVQNRSGYSVLLKATAGVGAPSDFTGAIELLPYSILAADLTLAQLWPGVAGTDVYAWCAQGAQVSFSHA